MALSDVVIRIVLATVLGGVIGIEREIREHTAGFRTHILVSVGAAAFTIASSYGLEGTSFDPNRITAQIVSGIGFLGAGAIIRYGVSVRGLTTAASLWAVAAVGLAVGQGFYSLALITTLLVVVSLYLLRVIEERVIDRFVGVQVGVRIRFSSGGLTALTGLLTSFREARVTVKEMVVEPGGETGGTLRLLLRLPRGMSRPELASVIAETEEAQIVGLE